MNNSQILQEIENLPLKEILHRYPIAADCLANLRLSDLPPDKPFAESIKTLDQDTLEEFGLDAESAVTTLWSFLSAFTAAGKTAAADIHSLTVIGGINKHGEAENIELTIKTGEILSIVGPTGSGKSRLLADIECLAQEDTPTRRRILVNGAVPDEDWRFSTGDKLVAQLSQNMNFVMDLTVSEFLLMHARSRLAENAEEVVRKCFACANTLAGEKFTIDTKVTQLSGGQSRALMIADTALMSASPIVLIDEIENAGIDRKLAIELLAGNEKIVLMSTHDPLLALRGTRRVVIANGGISAVLETTEDERASLARVEEIDAVLQDMRNRMRYGKRITADTIPKLVK